MKKIFVTGNIGSMRKFSYDRNGETAEAWNLSVATRDRTGETEWLKVLLFGKLANVAKFLYKGAQVCIEGTPRCEIYTKRDGTMGACISVVAQSLDLPPKAANPGANGYDVPAHAAPAPAPAAYEAADEDNPF